MLDMIIRKRGHGVIAMIIIWLVADIHTFHASLLRGAGEVFREQLSLFVEIVARPLCPLKVSLHTPHHICALCSKK